VTAEELLEQVTRAGVQLTPQLHVHDPAGAVTPALRAELALRKYEVLTALLQPEELRPLRELRGLYVAACRELVEWLGWPAIRVELPPSRGASFAIPCKANWLHYLKTASVPELREFTLPRLRELASAAPPPDCPTAKEPHR